MSYEDLSSAWLLWVQLNRGRAERTAQIYKLALQRLEEYFDGRDPLQATSDDLVAFTGPWLHKRGVVARSRRPYVAAVRGFYRWLNMRKAITGNPAVALDYPKTGR